MSRLDSGFATRPEKPLDALMPERFNHQTSVACGATDNKMARVVSFTLNQRVNL
jgi:hypothetical protein